MSQFSISGRAIGGQRAAIPNEPSSGRATTQPYPLPEGEPERYDNEAPVSQQRKEGDLKLGTNNRSAVGSLVERTTRFLLLLHLRGERSAEAVETAMRKAIMDLPDELRRSVTWDQGAEMAKHAAFTVATEIPIYFCDPHAPWQRGSNENTNGLLRQYLPKGMDLSTVTKSELRAIQNSLNSRPRKTLGYMTPSEKFAELVAATG